MLDAEGLVMNQMFWIDATINKHYDSLNSELASEEAERLPTDISMFTVSWTSPASLRYLLAADLKKQVAA